MPRIPNFADVGFSDPRSGTGTPQFPSSDPASAALEQFGAGVQKAGATAVSIGADMEEKRQKLNAANSSLGLFNELVPLHTQMQIETDPDKLGEIKTQMAGLLEKYSKGIDDPATKAAWLSQHGNTVIHAVTDVDKRYATLDRDRVGAGLHETMDTAARTAAATGDPAAIDAASAQIREIAKYGEEYGALKPGTGYIAQRQALDKMVRGAADNLITKGQPDAAIALLDKHQADIDPVASEVLHRRAEAKGSVIQGDAIANWALGLGPAPNLPKTPAGAGGMSVGGALPRRIADAAQAQNVDPTTALATAQIESAMGQNLGSRGNIFQLGRNEWASVGGGQMGDPETDIRNGIGFLAKTQNDLRAKLGREPQPWEVYLAHQQGVGGATALLSNPDKPAGQVVPAGNVRGNGGDPSAPASDFVGLWRDKFTQTAARIGAAAPSGDNNITAFGDSIAAHLIRKAGVPGQESGKVGIENAGDTAVSGYTPAKVLDVIQNAPEANIRGKNVVLSTGASNDPSQLDAIPQQIAALKQHGAASVTVMGVGTADRVRGVNDKLAQIAADNGATFSGPLRNVAGDGIHSSDPKAELAAVRGAMGQQPGLQAASIAQPPGAAGTDTGTETPPPGIQGGGPQQNRTGLPSISDILTKVEASGGSEAAKDHARKVAVAKYNAMETDAARAERVAVQQRRAQDEELEGTIIADAASPTPQWTAQGVMTDKRLSPEARMRMLNFLSSVSRKTGDHDTNTYGTGFYDAFRAIHAPEGDPSKITSPDQLYNRVGPNGDLTVAGLEKLRTEMISKRTPEGEAAAEMKKQFLDGAHKMITSADPLLHMKDPKGEELYLKFLAQTLPAYEEGLKKGKSPAMMFNPDSPDYLGKVMPQFIRPREQRMKDMLEDPLAGGASSSPASSSNPADYKTPQDLIQAVQSGKVPYDVGVAEARKRGYIPAQPSVPIR